MELDLESEAALEKLSALAKAHEDANKLKASEINILRRREQIALNEIEETTKLRQEVRDFNHSIKIMTEELVASVALQQLQMKKFQALEDEMEEMRNNMLLLLTEHSPQAVKEAVDELTRRKLLKKYQKNLDKLKEQAAEFGLEIPLRILNAIEKEQQNIDDLS